MAASPPQHVAIIGAGLAGLSLALALHAVSLPCTIYETRPAPYNIGGAIMLSPNALRVLDALGVYGRIRSKGYNFENNDFTDPDGKVLDTYLFGSERLYGYKALRIYRHRLIAELQRMLDERGIPVRYETKFAGIVSETDDGVAFRFADGSTSSASILVGADGIHSTVRRYVHPSVVPVFSGFVGVTAAAPRERMRIPDGYALPATIMCKTGAFVMAPQDPDGSEIFFGVQRAVPEQDREGWKKMFEDKQALLEFLRRDREHYPDIARSALEHVSTDKINMWPFYTLPKLDRWASDHGRVILVGDSAHAIPPTAGQGVNQAFEDVYSLSLLLVSLPETGVGLSAALGFWQEYRQERVENVLELNRLMTIKRMPAEQREKLIKDSVSGDSGGVSRLASDLAWLYNADLKKVVGEWVDGRK